MKMTQRLTRLLMCCVCISMIISLSLISAPAKAVQAPSEFDFSTEDSIDAYDSFRKDEVETDDGEVISRVYVGKQNAIKTEDTKLVSPSFYRYGAYLRNPVERQRYYFYNFDRKSNYSSIYMNTLTIYADPEVEFMVADQDNRPVVDSDGVREQSLVKYYNRTTEAGHIVYFIELTPVAETNHSEYTLTFWTESESVQPHYSFWYGAPLVRVGSELLGNFTVSVSAPNRVSIAYRLKGAYAIPERAWVNTMTINKLSSTGDNLTSRVELNIKVPGANSGMIAKSAKSPTLVFDDFPNCAIAHDARGTYQVYISRVNWSPTTLARGSYQYRGQLSVEYLYAFGA